MSSEWMKVMLEEIARKKDEEAQARLERELRRRDGDGLAPEAPPDSSSPPDAAARGGRPPRGAPPGGRPPR
jgi:hypothetical protein